MKIIKSNVTEVFKNLPQPVEIPISFVNGVYSVEDTALNQAILVTSGNGLKYSSSQIIQIDRSIYNKIEIVCSTDNLRFYIVALGENAAGKRIEYDDSNGNNITNKVIMLNQTKFMNNSLDTWMNYYAPDEKCCNIAISVSHDSEYQPYWNATELASAKIRLIP